VETVLDSQQGLDRALNGEYDLVICDLKMPHLDGRAFYRELGRDRLSPQAISHIETIAELAVRLRETVRRLSDTWASHHDPARTV
jgi:CheY-like chemotaxis protein